VVKTIRFTSRWINPIPTVTSLLCCCFVPAASTCYVPPTLIERHCRQISNQFCKAYETTRVVVSAPEHAKICRSFGLALRTKMRQIHFSPMLHSRSSSLVLCSFLCLHNHLSSLVLFCRILLHVTGFTHCAYISLCVFDFLLMFPLSSIIFACMLYYGKKLKWAWWDS